MSAAKVNDALGGVDVLLTNVGSLVKEYIHELTSEDSASFCP